MRVDEPGGPDAVSINPDQPVYQVNIFKRVDAEGIPEEMSPHPVSEWKLRDTRLARSSRRS
jgi:hypothetical protein